MYVLTRLPAAGAGIRSAQREGRARDRRALPGREAKIDARRPAAFSPVIGKMHRSQAGFKVVLSTRTPRVSGR
ncbi:hypothetical protein [Streptomyces sp. S.PB5]|uniref:hypothetical protein n=1 Tax=Streptomyces sp. S.PB5 TaxID=3020844 RepID=UPI0025B0EC3E|nr:hypothetical protein [Streptomyces sp. S.PB5]MDN3028569.1 hypothetical protein [Streptomyces sp. S.PB5]